MKDRPKVRHLLFSFLSVAYGSTIFLMADSPLAMSLSLFNPKSILHIPLYGILALLLFLSIPPAGKRLFRSTPREARPLDSGSSICEDPPGEVESLPNGGNRSARRRMWIAGLVSFAVAVADELHQSTIPRREASLSDIGLDVVGILLAFWIFHWLSRKKVPWLESW